MTLTWNGKQFDWVNIGWFAAIHAGALLAPWTFTWTGLGVALGLWWFVGSIGICMTYHRLLTHRGFTLWKPLEYVGTVAGMLASEGGAISWVAMHRIHHANSDQPGQDVHTPKDGFVWSHIGWILTKLGVDYREMERRWAPELVADPVHRVLNRIHWVPNVVLRHRLLRLGRLVAGRVGHLGPAGADAPRHLVRQLGLPTPGATAPGRRRRTRATSGGSGSSPGARAGTTRTTPSSARPATASAGSST